MTILASPPDPGCDSLAETASSVLKECGIVAWLAKPARERQLHDAVFGQSEIRSDAECATAPVLAVAGRRILVVEDNVVNQKVVLRQLQKLGYPADCVANGLEAIAAMENIRYDLVLMDCHMPEMDGFEATAEIRRREWGGARTPIIALTASALESDRQACLLAGMDDFVTKPIRVTDLADALRRWLDPQFGAPATNAEWGPSLDITVERAIETRACTMAETRLMTRAM